MFLSKIIKHAFLAPIFGVCYWMQTCSAPTTLGDLQYDKPLRLRVPTYDGSFQAVHPDIADPKATGGPFVLAFTPYPFTDDRYENPSLVVSDDGIRFREEHRGLSPLAPRPRTDHNDDPDISIHDGEYRILYLETLRPFAQNLRVLRSRDRRHWTNSGLIHYDFRAPSNDPMIVSPALAERGGETFLYYVNVSAKPYRIEYLTGSNLENLDKRDPLIPIIPGVNIVPWHVDIAKDGDAYYLLITDVSRGKSGKDYDLYIAKSKDLVTWTMASRKVFSSKPLGASLIYRSSAFCSGGDFFIYFSYKTKLGAWRIGLVRSRIRELFPGSDS